MKQVHITHFQADGAEVHVCYPIGSRRETSALQLNFTAPVYLVYGDKTRYTEEEAARMVQHYGLDLAAADGGGLVLVLCGSSAEGWTAADADAYHAVLRSMNPDTSAEYVFGVGKGRNFFTKAEELRIVGFPQTVHLVGIGKGADFVGANMLRPLQEERRGPDGKVSVTDRSPASVLLADASRVPTVDAGVIPGSDTYRLPLRVSAINCPAGTADALRPLGPGNWRSVEADFGDKGLSPVLLNFNTRYLRQAEQLLPVPDYARLGIACRKEYRTVPTAPENRDISTPTHDIHYALFYPEELDLQRDHVPLLLTFHGGGSTALFMSIASQWPQIAREEGFMVAAVDQHTSCPAKEIMALIHALKERYPCIDMSRLYANGYSMGGVKCWELIEQFPDVFAGIAPMHGSFAVGVEDIPAQPTPVFYVAGETTFLPEFPSQGENLQQRLDYVLKLNRVPMDYQPDYSVNPWWGINGHRREQIPDPVTYLNSILTVEYFDSEDGRCITAMAGGSNEGHEVYDRNCRAAWAFLKRFSRAADGTIIEN